MLVKNKVEEYSVSDILMPREKNEEIAIRVKIFHKDKPGSAELARNFSFEIILVGAGLVD